jgi:hypothetical protein
LNSVVLMYLLPFGHIVTFWMNCCLLSSMGQLQACYKL